MNKNLKVSNEYEARAMLSLDEYNSLVSFYNVRRNHPILTTNINKYFDTDDLYLVHHHMVLRIREVVNQKLEMTLKIKGEEGDIELTNDNLRANKALNPAYFDENISKALSDRGVDVSSIRYVAELKTERIEIIRKNYLIVIDKNFYNDKIDYNIEVESDSKKNAKKYLKKILDKFSIEYKKDYASKSRRAILKL